MKQFFNNLLATFRGIGQSDGHQKKLFYGSIIVYLLLGLVFGYISSVIFTAALAFMYELTHCYIPYKEKKILGFNVNLPDYSVLKNINLFDIQEYHAFNIGNIYFSACGIVIGVVIRLILWIL